MKGPKPVLPEVRFWKYIDKDGPIHPVLLTHCWLWKGTKHNLGYGVFQCSGKRISAHRFSYEIHVGIIPPGKLICHRCDNPPCCNPEHLFCGTHHDNSLDMVKKNRHRKIYNINGESNPAAKLTEPQVLRIRQMVKDKIPQKQIATEFSVSLTLVEKIISRSVWSHI